MRGARGTPAARSARAAWSGWATWATWSARAARFALGAWGQARGAGVVAGQRLGWGEAQRGVGGRHRGPGVAALDARGRRRGALARVVEPALDPRRQMGVEQGERRGKWARRGGWRRGGGLWCRRYLRRGGGRRPRLQEGQGRQEGRECCGERRWPELRSRTRQGRAGPAERQE